MRIDSVLDAWAKITIEIWLDKIKELNINDTESLAQSFVQHVIANSSGDTARIEFAFNYYGRMVDMGVGQGVKKEEVFTSNRNPKPWYSSTFLLEVKKLANILADQYGHQSNLIVVNSIKGA